MINQSPGKQSIISYIRRNRISSTEIADCLGKSGAIEKIHAINKGHFVVGNVHWAYAYGETNWHLHEQIQNVVEGDILLVDVFNCNNRAVLGDIVAKYLLLYKQAAAIIVIGNVRDAPRLIKENWPIWCAGFNPVGCWNNDINDDLDSVRKNACRDNFHETIAVCDDTGVVVIPQSFHNERFLEQLHKIEEQEDIWYECIDRKKWSTFETICLKKYLDSPDE